jgi:hypothetical protein
VHDVLHDALAVAVLLGKIQSLHGHGTLAAARVRLEDPALAEALRTDDLSHGSVAFKNSWKLYPAGLLQTVQAATTAPSLVGSWALLGSALLQTTPHKNGR